MDQIGADVTKHASITFEQMDRRLDEHVRFSDVPEVGRLERRLYFIAALVLAGGCVSALFGQPGSNVALVLFGCAWILLFAGMYRSVRRNWKSSFYFRRDFARQLDYHQIRFNECVAWLKHCSEEDLRRKLRYVRARKTALINRLGWVVGGVERLGILPLVLALYLQFGEWRWTDWNSLPQANQVGSLLLCFLIGGYGVGWAAIGLRTRLEQYEALLEEASIE